MTIAELEQFYIQPAVDTFASPMIDKAHDALLAGLESGTLRAAICHQDRTWHANAWVKEAILAGFRHSKLTVQSGPTFPFFDKTAFPIRQLDLSDGVRLVPGGSAVRRGAHVAPGVVIMPPAYINVGAFVGAGTMVDSHALVGSCAQIGERVHLSAGAQIGGVLEPAGATPVVIEDDAFIGGLVGVFEGVVVRKRAVLAAGVVLTASTPIYDLVQGRVLRREVPEGAVVVAGTRSVAGEFAMQHGVSINAAVIIKYRDDKTDAATALESALR